LQSLCLRKCDIFTWETVLDVLHQCSDLYELRVGQLDHNFPKQLSQAEFVNLRTFRVEFHQMDASTVVGLSELMPRLTTAILISQFFTFREGAKKLIDSFPYMRQLVTIPQYEDKLRPLQPSTHEDYTTHKPTAGSRLEELFDSTSMEIVQTMLLPALQVLGCYNIRLLPVLPSHVKKLVLVSNGRGTPETILCGLCGLEEIDITYDGAICSEAIRRMALQNPQLQVLNVQQILSKSNTIPVLSADGLWTFLAHCPQLHSVVYSATRQGQTVDSVAHLSALLKRSLCRAFPHLKNLTYSLVV